MENLKRTVIKEEYLELTGNIFDAVILNLLVELMKNSENGWVKYLQKN